MVLTGALRGIARLDCFLCVGSPTRLTMDEWGSLRASAATTALQQKCCNYGGGEDKRDELDTLVQTEGQEEVSSCWTSSDRLPPLAQWQTHRACGVCISFFPFSIFFFPLACVASRNPEERPCIQRIAISWVFCPGPKATHPSQSRPSATLRFFLAEDAIFFNGAVAHFVGRGGRRRATSGRHGSLIVKTCKVKKEKGAVYELTKKRHVWVTEITVFIFSFNLIFLLFINII